MKRRRNIRLTIAYDGSRYAGWQSQTNATAIQDVLERAIATITGEKVRVTGSGRTDAGAHALAQVANFKSATKLSSRALHGALRQRLPSDIVVTKVADAPAKFNAQFDARGKHYRYTVLTGETADPFVRHVSFHYRYPISLQAMRRAARYLVGRHNFKSFQTVDRARPDASSVRTVRKIAITATGPLVIFDIEADGFLYNMVRNIVGTILEVGRGKISVASIPAILDAKDKRRCGPTVPARGLCLMRVTY